MLSSHCGDRIQDLLEVRREVDLPRTDVLRDQRDFLHQRHAHHRQRQDHDEQTDGQRRERGGVALAGHLPQQPLVERREQDRQRHAPQHRAEERQQHPDEGGGDGGEQGEEHAALELG
jgi:hypothetical protein